MNNMIGNNTVNLVVVNGASSETYQIKYSWDFTDLVNGVMTIETEKLDANPTLN